MHTSSSRQKVFAAGTVVEGGIASHPEPSPARNDGTCVNWKLQRNQNKAKRSTTANKTEKNDSNSTRLWWSHKNLLCVFRMHLMLHSVVPRWVWLKPVAPKKRVWTCASPSVWCYCSWWCKSLPRSWLATWWWNDALRLTVMKTAFRLIYSRRKQW